MLKTLVIGIVIAVGAVALGALMFSACWSVFAPALSWPPLSWWQSFCLLWAVGCIGGASGMSRTIKATRE